MIMWVVAVCTKVPVCALPCVYLCVPVDPFHSKACTTFNNEEKKERTPMLSPLLPPSPRYYIAVVCCSFLHLNMNLRLSFSSSHWEYACPFNTPMSIHLHSRNACCKAYKYLTLTKWVSCIAGAIVCAFQFSQQNLQQQQRQQQYKKRAKCTKRTLTNTCCTKRKQTHTYTHTPSSQIWHTKWGGTFFQDNFQTVHYNIFASFVFSPK